MDIQPVDRLIIPAVVRLVIRKTIQAVTALHKLIGALVRTYNRINRASQQQKQANQRPHSLSGAPNPQIDAGNWRSRLKTLENKVQPGARSDREQRPCLEIELEYRVHSRKITSEDIAQVYQLGNRYQRERHSAEQQGKSARAIMHIQECQFNPQGSNHE